MKTRETHDKLLEICPWYWFITIVVRVLMFCDVAGESKVGVPLEKIAYIGQAAELVSNIDSHYEDPTLYSENGTYITSWKGNTAEPSDCKYVGKFHMDDKRNIWILRVDSEDAGKYSIQFGVEHEVQIILTVKGHLPEEQIGKEVRKLLIEQTEHIKGFLGNLAEKQNGQIRKLQDDNTELIKGFLANFTGEQIMQIRELLDEQTNHFKKYVEETISKLHRQPNGWYILFLGLLICMFINEITGNQIGKGLIKMKVWIQKKLYQHKIENVSQTPNTVIHMEQPGIPQPVQIRSHCDSPDSTSYKLMWDKPDDGGSPLIKYIIRYCELAISLNGTEYELSKPLNPLEISPSDESFTLSSLEPGSYYQVEVQALNTVGMSSKKFIFKTKENETNSKLRSRLSKKIENLPPRINPIRSDVPSITDT